MNPQATGPRMHMNQIQRYNNMRIRLCLCLFNPASPNNYRINRVSTIKKDATGGGSYQLTEWTSC